MQPICGLAITSFGGSLVHRAQREEAANPRHIKTIDRHSDPDISPECPEECTHEFSNFSAATRPSPSAARKVGRSSKT